MTRPHVYDPPPHMADVAHVHTCPTCLTVYGCLNPAHEPGSPRPCGSAPSVCKPTKPTTKEHTR